MPKKIYNDINLGIVNLGIANKKILDVGCGAGLLGGELRKNNNFVYGIDISEEELAMARPKLDAVKKVDVTASSFDLPADFDVIVCADILEHLADPLTALRQLRRHLKNKGETIVSLPNIACFTTRLALFFGQFNYQDYGILDKTHLRFFTQKTARRLVEEAGFKIVKVDVTPYFIRPLFRLWRSWSRYERTDGKLEKDILESKYFQFYKNRIFPVERLMAKIWPSLLAYQFIIVAQSS